MGELKRSVEQGKTATVSGQADQGGDRNLSVTVKYQPGSAEWTRGDLYLSASRGKESIT